jgi:AcrR family transcriptional regulator
LLDAARSVFLEKSVGATTAEIARKARVSESVIFHRYKTKEALFLAVLERERRIPPLVFDLEERVGRGEVAATLFDLGMAVIEAGRAFMPFLAIASTMAQASNWKVDTLRERMRKPRPELRRAVQLVARYFEAEATRGRLRKFENPEAIAMVFFSSMMQHIMHLQWWAQELPLTDTPSFVRTLVDVFLNGMAPRRAGKSSR